MDQHVTENGVLLAPGGTRGGYFDTARRRQEEEDNCRVVQKSAGTVRALRNDEATG